MRNGIIGGVGHIQPDVIERFLASIDAMSPEQYAALFAQAQELEDIAVVLAEQAGAEVLVWKCPLAHKAPPPSIEVTTDGGKPRARTTRAELGLAA